MDEDWDPLSTMFSDVMWPQKSTGPPQPLGSAEAPWCPLEINFHRKQQFVKIKVNFFPANIFGTRIEVEGEEKPDRLYSAQ